MKKILLNLFLVGNLSVLAISCQSDKKANDADSTNVIVQNDSAIKKQAIVDSTKHANALPVTAAEVEKAKVQAPDFSSEEVNNGFKEFSAIKESYITALKDKNDEAIKAAKEKYNAWAIRAVTWGTKLTPEENQKYIDYYEKLVQQWEIAERKAYAK